jgi:DNA-binding NarL/FixJ family response regulator
MIRVLLADDQALGPGRVPGALDAQEGTEVVGEAADGGEALRLVRRDRARLVVFACKSGLVRPGWLS